MFVISDVQSSFRFASRVAVVDSINKSISINLQNALIGLPDLHNAALIGLFNALTGLPDECFFGTISIYPDDIRFSFY